MLNPIELVKAAPGKSVAIVAGVAAVSVLGYYGVKKFNNRNKTKELSAPSETEVTSAEVAEVKA